MAGYERGHRGPPDSDRGYDRPDRFVDRLGPARGDRGGHRYGNYSVCKVVSTRIYDAVCIAGSHSNAPWYTGESHMAEINSLPGTIEAENLPSEISLCEMLPGIFHQGMHRLEKRCLLLLRL